MNITMPSGIHYDIPLKSVKGKAHKLRAVFAAIIAIERKAEEIRQSRPRGDNNADTL